MSSHSTEVIRIGSRYLKLLLFEHRRHVALNMVLLCVLGFLNGVGILLLIPLLEAAGVGDRLPGTESVAGPVTWCFDSLGLAPTVFSVLGAFLVITGVQAAMQRWHAILNAQLLQDFIQSMRNGLYESIVHCSWLFYLKTPSSDFRHSLNSDINRVSQGTVALLKLISTLMITSVHVALAMLISPIMTAATIGSLFLYWPLLSHQNRLARDAGRSATTRTRQFFARINDQLTGMKELKTFGAESRQLEQFRHLTSSIHSAHIAFARAQAGTSMVYTFGSALLLSVLVLIAVEVLELPLAEFALLILIFAKLMPNLREVHRNYQLVLHMLPAFVAATEFRARCEAACEREPETSAPSLTLEKAITLNEVSFRYDDQIDVWALRDVNLRFPARKTTAIVGPSGAGKSTLVDLLMGLMSAERGEVRVDDRLLNPDSAHQWRRTVGYVPQETILLHDTIRENMLWAQPGASDDDISTALSMAAADGFVAGRCDGMETLAGDRGTHLSGGERQRIALARALLRQPAVLMVDEATSNLDARNQQRIQEATKRLSGTLTMIIVAHRLSTIRHADQIVVLEAGRVVESGTWDELAARPDGHFRSLIATSAGLTS